MKAAKQSHMQTLERNYIYEGDAELNGANQSWVKHFQLNTRYFKQNKTEEPPGQGTTLHPVCAVSKTCCLKWQHSKAKFLLVPYAHHRRESCKLILWGKPTNCEKLWQGVGNTRWHDILLAGKELCAQSQNTTNCEARINNQTAVMDDSRSVSSGIIGENTENSFPLNILNSLFGAELMLPEKPFNTASINFSGCLKQESLGCWKSSPQKGCCLQKTHQLCSAGKSFDLFYTIHPVTEEANMGMKYGHGAKHKKRLNKMSNYVFPKPSHASRRHIPS